MPVARRRERRDHRGDQVETAVLQRNGDADQHQHAPHRCGEVMTDADQHVHAADPVQAARAHHLGVLQVALAPAAVAHQQVGQRRRAFLVAALQVRHHVHGPAATTHQCRFDEVVAEHVAAERLAPGQRRQARLRGEGLGANHRVVAPVVAFRPVPPGHAEGDHRAVDAAAELLHAREQGVAVDHFRQGLDQADVGVGLHAGSQAHDAVAGHQAVGVQDQHLRIGAAETTHPVGDVAGFAPGIAGAAPIEQATLAADALHQLGVHLLFFRADGRARGVAEDEEIEALDLAGGRHRFVDRLQAGHQPVRILVVGGHQQRGAVAHLRQRRVRIDAELAALAEHQGEEAGQRAHERQRDPGEQRDEQHHQTGFEHAHAADHQDLADQPTGVGGHRRGGAEHVEAPPADPDRGAGQARVAQFAFLQRLQRHGQRRLGRQDRVAGIQGSIDVHGRCGGDRAHAIRRPRPAP
ncbi:hypothetical protein NB689_001922 [Xanthomonas sacchari]|nr:hypothetical protein [Xanthomonas sacchari]